MLFHEIFRNMKIHTRIRQAMLWNLQTYEEPHKNPTRYSTKYSNLWWSTYELVTLFYKNLQNHEDTHTNPARYSTKSSNLWRSTHEPRRLFYKIFKPLKVHTRVRHAFLQYLQTYEDLHKNPARYSTKSSNPWWFTHEPDRLFYKIYKPMKINTRIRQAYSRKSSNQWRFIHESGMLFYKIFKPMMIYTRIQHIILRNQLHYIITF